MACASISKRSEIPDSPLVALIKFLSLTVGLSMISAPAAIRSALSASDAATFLPLAASIVVYNIEETPAKATGSFSLKKALKILLT